MRLSEENIKKIFQGIGTGKDLMDKTPKAQETNAKVDRLHYTKTKTSCTVKKPGEEQITEWEKIFSV